MKGRQPGREANFRDTYIVWTSCNIHLWVFMSGVCRDKAVLELGVVQRQLAQQIR